MQTMCVGTRMESCPYHTVLISTEALFVRVGEAGNPVSILAANLSTNF
jgi:hypothetical protein